MKQQTFCIFRRMLSTLLAMLMIVSIMPISILAEKIQELNNSDEVNRYTVLLLDTEKAFTMKNSYGGFLYEVATPIEAIKLASIKFVEQIQVANGNNYVAIVTYNSKVEVISDFTTNTEKLKAKIENLGTGENWADIESALSQAGSMLDSIEDIDAVKNIVLFTQGVNFSGKHSTSGKYSMNDCDWRRLDNNIYFYEYANCTYETAKLLMPKYYLYSIGLFQSFDKVPNEGRPLLNFAKRFTKDIQNAGYYEVTDPNDLEFTFGDVADDITNKSTGYEFKFGGQINSTEDTKSICYYTDDYFFKDPSKYDESLATMSLSLELSSWTSHDTKKNSNWDAVTATKNIEDLLTGEIGGTVTGNKNLGFTNFYRSDDMYQKPTNDSIGAVAAQKKINNGEKEYTLIALAVRGGGYGSEWASNLTIGNEGNHLGFKQASNKVLKFLYKYAETTGITGDIKLWIVGYSRAAITANMVAGSLCMANNFSNDISFKAKDDLYCYTFETPQGIISSIYQAEACKNIHNIINLNDLVPLVAPDIWDFTRYNEYNEISGSGKLPSASTENDFIKYQEMMKDELRKIIKEANKNDFEYKINEYNKYLSKVQVNLTKILPGGEPFIELVWKDDEGLPVEWLLKNTVEWLFKDALTPVGFNIIMTNREYYSLTIEPGIRALAGILTDYYGSSFDISNITLFSRDNLIYYLSPIFSINPFYSKEERMADVEKRFKEKYELFVKQLSEGIVNAAEMTTALMALFPVLKNTISTLADDLFDKNDDDFFMLVNFVEYLAWSGFQAHFPEICLAWIRSQDPNYNPNAPQTSNSSITRVIHINCPVDIDVYNNDDILVAQIINDNVVDIENSSIICLINENDEKIIYLPGNGDYYIDIEATDNGTVTYTVDEYNYIYNSSTRLLNYYNVPVTIGDHLKGIVPAISNDELLMNDINGSSVNYTLLDNDLNIINADEEYIGEDIKDEYYNVILTLEGNAGYITGAGKYQKGNFAKLEAQILPNSEFYGWYIDDTLISTDLIYRFAVTEDVKITAKVKDVEYHEMKLETTTGGKITSVEGYYSEDIKIAIVAEAEAGYEFDYWSSSNGGVFDDINSKETTFVMPNNNVVITAHFKYVGNDDDNTSEKNNSQFIFPNLFEVNVNVGKGGKANVSKTFYIAYGASRTIKITSDEGYEVKDVIINGKSIGSVNTYTIKGACESYNIEITFGKIE